ncbi:MAG: DUF1800 family protein [Planctomycetota bacterium]
MWVNPALRLVSSDAMALIESERSATERCAVETGQLEVLLIDELCAGSAPLRGTMTLFFLSLFGKSHRAVGTSKAMWEYVYLLQRYALTSIPSLLRALVLAPASLIQHGYDGGHRRLPPRLAATRILDHWLVGPGQYSEADAEALARALTGWSLEAPPGRSMPSDIDPRGARKNQRTGLVPRFDPERFDGREKTILGSTGDFDALRALDVLALHPRCAAFYAERLIGYFGVVDPNGRLLNDLTRVYLDRSGDVSALLETLVCSDEFGSTASRWQLIKSPVHLAVGACRAMDVAPRRGPNVRRWLKACGPSLLDAPMRGAEPWPAGRDWLLPAARLAARYRLGEALFGAPSALGLRSREVEAGRADSAVVPWMDELDADGDAARVVDGVLERLDPAPGLRPTLLAAAANGTPGLGLARRVVLRLFSTPEFQLA